MTMKPYQPHSLFYQCEKTVRWHKNLEKELFWMNLEMPFKFSYEITIDIILKLISFPYLKRNRQFERYFRKLVKSKIFYTKDVQLLFTNTNELIDKIYKFHRIYGVVDKVLDQLLQLRSELYILLL